MVANSLQGILGTVMYFAGVFAILGILAPSLITENQSAYQKSADSIASSVSAQLDALRPGMSTTIQIQEGNVMISGSTLTVSLMGAHASDPLDWSGSMSFASGTSYVVSLDGTGLVVS